MRAVAGSAAGGGDDQTEHLQAADQVEQRAGGDGGDELRHRDVPELLPAVGAVHRGRLIIHIRDAVQAGDVYDHGLAAEVQGVDDHDDEHGAVADAHPVQLGAAEQHDDVVQRAAVVLHHEVPDVADQQLRDHGGQVHDGARQAAQREAPLQQQRVQHAQYRLEERAAEAVDHGIPEGPQEHGIGEKLRVIGEANIVRVLGVAVPVGQGDLDTHHQRDRHEYDHQDHCGGGHHQDDLVVGGDPGFLLKQFTSPASLGEPPPLPAREFPCY